MKVHFVGAVGGDVTGSCTHFKYKRTNTEFLVDCGMYQGGYRPEDRNAKPFPFNPSKIKFVILTHAHLDHCGLIPLLYREGFNGKVFCTSATAELCRLQLDDAERFANGLFDRCDVARIDFVYVDKQPNFGLSRFIPIDLDLTAAFTRSAHVLGSVSVNICWIKSDGSKANIFLSGDIGGNTKTNAYGSLLAGAQTPYGHPEYLVLESTYGILSKDEEHTSFEKRTDALAQIINNQVVGSHHILIIPAFSLQRTQEILFDVYYVLSRKDGDLSTASNNNSRICNDKFFDGNGWPTFIQEAIDDLVTKLPEPDRGRWLGAFERRNTKWFIKEEAALTLADVQSALSKQLRPYPIEVVVEAPLARQITKVFGRELCRRQRMNPEKTLFRNRQMATRLAVADEHEVDDVIKKLFPENADSDQDILVGIHRIRYADVPELPTRKKLFNQGMILITGAGMCEGGPILKHLQKSLPREDAIILLTGYMARETLGNKLVSISRARNEAREMPFSSITVDRKVFSSNEIVAKIVEFGAYYSGHAGGDTLLSFISNEIPKATDHTGPSSQTVFLNHGEDDARTELKNAILAMSEADDRCRVARVELPSRNGGWFDLDRGEWCAEELTCLPEEGTASLLELLIAEQKRTNTLLEKLLDLHTENENSSVRMD